MSAISMSLREARQLYELLQQIDSQVDQLTVDKQVAITAMRNDLQDLQISINSVLGFLHRLNLPEDVLAAIRKLQSVMAILRGTMALMAAMELIATGGLSPFGWMRAATGITAGFMAIGSAGMMNQEAWEMESRRRR